MTSRHNDWPEKVSLHIFITRSSVLVNSRFKAFLNSIAFLLFFVGLSPTSSAHEWTELGSMERARFAASAFQYKHDFYIFNGFKKGVDLEPTIERFSADSLTWEILGSTNVLGTSVTHNGVTLVGSDVWVIGGRQGDHPGPVVETVSIYNIDENAWRVGPSLPVPVAGGGAALVNNKIHWIGGLDQFAQCDLPHHYVYDVDNPETGWQDITDVAPMPAPRNHFGTAVFDGLIYTIGGQVGHGGCATGNTGDTNLVHTYNPETKEWLQKASLPSIQSHIEPGTFVHAGAIYVLGGTTVSSAIFRYNPANDTWDTLFDLPEDLVAPAGRVVHRHLVVASGGAPSFKYPTGATRYTDVAPLLLPQSAPPASERDVNSAEQSPTEQSPTEFNGDENGDAARAIDGTPAASEHKGQHRKQ